MFVPKKKLTQLFFILSTFTRLAKLAKIDVDLSANNYFFGFQGTFANSPRISAQNQQEMAKLSSISEDGIGMLGYLYLGALKGLENRKIKISKGSLHFFWVQLYAEECQKSGSSCLFEKNPLGLFTNDEDIEYTLPFPSESSMFLGEVKFSGAIKKSFLHYMFMLLTVGGSETLDSSENSQMVLLRGVEMALTLENGRQKEHKDGTCSLFLEKSINTKLRITLIINNITIFEMEMGLTNRVTGDVLDKAIKLTPPEEFDEEYDFNEVATSNGAFDESSVKKGKIYWSNIGENEPTTGEDDEPPTGENDEPTTGEDDGSGREGKDTNDDGKGADGKPQDESLFSKAIFWVIAVLSVGLVVGGFFIYKNATKNKYVVSRTSSPRAQKVKITK